MPDPLSYLEEILADAEGYIDQEDQGNKKIASGDNPNERIAAFLDKVAESIENNAQFDEQTMSMFVGENTNNDTLKLRESVKNRIQQLGSMGIPG